MKTYRTSAQANSSNEGEQDSVDLSPMLHLLHLQNILGTSNGNVISIDQEEQEEQRLAGILRDNERSMSFSTATTDQGPSKRRRVSMTASSSSSSEDDKSHQEEFKEPSFETAKLHQHQENNKATHHHDPFLYYSNDKQRLERLMGRELPHLSTPDNEKKPAVRKTRISFELDPFYMLMTSFPEIFGEGILNLNGDEGAGE